MEPHKYSLYNAILLIVLSLWAYFSSDAPSNTVFIPTAVGVVLLVCNPGIKNQNKIIAHAAVILTFLIIVGLIKPLLGGIDDIDWLSIFRVGLMILSSIIALIAFINSFIEARRE